MSSFILNALATFSNLGLLFGIVMAFGEIFFFPHLVRNIIAGNFWSCISGTNWKQDTGESPEYPRTMMIFPAQYLKAIKREPSFQSIQLQYCCQIAHLSPLHLVYNAWKSAAGEIVLPAPAKLCCSDKRTLSNKANTKSSNVSVCLIHVNIKILNNWKIEHCSR